MITRERGGRKSITGECSETERLEVHCLWVIVKMEDLLFFGDRGKVFAVEELLSSEAKVLGKGTFGITYKAVLSDGDTVAVKRFKVPCDFHIQKIEEIGKMVNENLLPLRAYSNSKSEKLLISDFMPMGSLFDHLHDTKKKRSQFRHWGVRCKVAYEIGCALEYLHSHGPNVCHGNIRSSNVLLTTSFDVRLTDFGVAQLLSSDSNENFTLGYRAPEVNHVHNVSQKSDVFSFGVLLLELITGMAPKNKKGVVDLPKWVRLTLEERPTVELFDRNLQRDQKIEDQMLQILQLAICCTFEYPRNRPSIMEVTDRIRDICSDESCPTIENEKKFV